MWSPNITLLLRAVLPEYHMVYVICNQQILFVSVLFTITVLKIVEVLKIMLKMILIIWIDLRKETSYNLVQIVFSKHFLDSFHLCFVFRVFLLYLHFVQIPNKNIKVA